jgi:predicted DNA-binding transcriptional regulator AlpA
MQVNQINSIHHLDALPDNAFITRDDVCVMLSIHETTAIRHERTTPGFPKPRKLSRRCIRYRLGDVRRYLRDLAEPVVVEVPKSRRVVECDDKRKPAPIATPKRKPKATATREAEPATAQ